MLRRSPPIALLTVTLCALVPDGEAGPRPRGSHDLDPGRIPWTRLKYEARKFFMKGTSEVRFATFPSAELDGQLIESPRGVALRPRGPRTSLLELRSAFAGRGSEIKVWFDPREAAALQRYRLRLGKKGNSKTYRFTRDGVFSRRRAPGQPEERGRPADEWSKMQDDFYPHPAALADCSAVSEPTVLFYLVAAAELGEGGAPLRLCTFSKKVLSRVALRPDGSKRVSVDYLEMSHGRQRRRRGEIQALRIAVEARPLDPGAEGDFEFLGLEGDVELFLDGRLPVLVSGRLPGLGRINVKLAEAELR